MYKRLYILSLMVLAAACLCITRAHADSLSDWVDHQLSIAPTYGSAILVYTNESGVGRESIVGLDVGSRAWFVISNGNVLAQTPDGSQFHYGLEHVGFVEPESKLHPTAINNYFPFYLLSELIHDPLRKRVQSVDRVDGGGFEITLSLVLGDMYLDEADLPESWGERYEQVRLHIDGHGRLIRRENLVKGSGSYYEYDERSPLEFPFVTSRSLIEPPVGKHLKSVEYYPEGRSDLFTHEGIRAIYESVGHRSVSVPALPSGITWAPPGEAELFSEEELKKRQDEMNEWVREGSLPAGTHVRSQWSRWLLPTGIVVLIGTLIYRFKKTA